MTGPYRQTLRSVGDVLPPAIATRARALKNRRNLYGMHAPAKFLTDLVPTGKLALDIGAAHGLYTYFIAKNATRTLAFEPNPAQFARLKHARLRSVDVFQKAVSDANGSAVLHVPTVQYGEASLEIHADRGEVFHHVRVEVTTIDDLQLPPVGFIKIDVEGHELRVLNGGQQTIQRFMPTILVELEERHSSGIVQSVSSLLSTWGYRYGSFLQAGQQKDISVFDTKSHQTAYSDPSDPMYVTNFIFR